MLYDLICSVNNRIITGDKLTSVRYKEYLFLITPILIFPRRGGRKFKVSCDGCLDSFSLDGEGWDGGGEQGFST